MPRLIIKLKPAALIPHDHTLHNYLTCEATPQIIFLITSPQPLGIGPKWPPNRPGAWADRNHGGGETLCPFVCATLTFWGHTAIWATPTPSLCQQHPLSCLLEISSTFKQGHGRPLAGRRQLQLPVTERLLTADSLGQLMKGLLFISPHNLLHQRREVQYKLSPYRNG